MKTANIIALLVKNLVSVSVQFKDSEGVAVGKVYHYLSTDASIEAGSEVVVDSPWTGLTMGVVSEVTRAVDLKDGINYKWVVQKVDRTTHDERLERLAEAQEKFAVLEADARQKALLAELAETLGDGAAETLQTLINDINK